MIPEAATKLSIQFINGYFLPAAFFVLAVAVGTKWPSSVSDPLDLTSISAVMFVAAVALATLLNMFNPFLVRCFEGLYFPAFIANAGRKKWTLRLQHLDAQIHTLKSRGDEASQDKAFQLESWRFSEFPSDKESVLPTHLGNAMAAWEHYPYRRYGMDAITMWPRLAPLLSRQVSEQIATAKARFDLLFNAIVLFLAWGVVRTTLLSWPDEGWTLAAWLVVCIVCALIAGRLSLAAASGYGETVKAAFDLHRLDLLKQMGVVVSSSALTVDDERKLWEQLQWGMKFRHVPNVTSVSPQTRSGPGKDAEPPPDPA
jgi:hypothetical protein